jgi:hypothetical protein
VDDDRVITAGILRQNAQTSLKGASAICHRSDGAVSTRPARISHRLKTARKWWVFREGGILIPELVSNVCFGRRKRNRLFITAQTSLYAVYVNAQGALRPRA